ncbi:hypothetical protein C7H85_00605 [Zobellella endophytica]|uniref:Nucleoside 2-deoxyribosyltransferase n=2 Tax=Zobellella endophytica TaxID=2116700 RepID=A0A2P7RB20_9GAMM|nr:hypothetical protein C7H85_00605 [Zobellella endophytica]
MFHLLVSYQGWPDSGGRLSMSRVYIREEDPVGNRFYSNGTLDIAKLKEYPALLVTETGGDGPQYARVAYITNVTLGHSEISIQYAIDNSIQPISNAELEGHSVELRLGRFGLSHTCWSVCDVDLYKLLLQNQQKRSVSPKVFSLEAAYSQDENLVSIMMPFGAEFNPIYSVLQQSVTSIGFSCVRADDIWEHHTIIQDIVNIIARAKVVICDCSGKNPNVFYEAGIAHAIGKDVILITQSEQDVPFDLRHIRYIRYLPNSEGLGELSASLQTKLRSIRGW